MAASSRTAFKAKGKVWIVQTTIFLSPESAVGQFAALAAFVAVDRRDDAACSLEIEEGFLKLRVNHRAIGNDEHGIEQLLVCASCKSARKCAVHAMEFVLPDPAECWTRYLLPGPSASTAAWSLRVTSS